MAKRTSLTITRRTFLQRTVGVLAGVSAVPAVLAACAPPGTAPAPTAAPTKPPES